MMYHHHITTQGKRGQGFFVVVFFGGLRSWDGLALATYEFYEVPDQQMKAPSTSA